MVDRLQPTHAAPPRAAGAGRGAIRALRPTAAAAALVLLSAACSTVQTSAVAASAPHAAYAGTVEVRATSIPPGARELGIVDAHGPNAPIEKLVPELVKRAAKMGGNFVKIDRIKTHYDMKTQVQTYSYACGKATCTGTRTMPVEVATTTVQGRAFLVPGLRR